MLEGNPIEKICFTAEKCRESDFHFIAYGASVFVSTYMTRSAESNSEIIVAYAAPSTPMRKPTTKRRSKTTLTIAAKQRKYSGRRESPTARSMPEPML